MRCFILELPQYSMSLLVFSFDQTFPEERRVFLRDNHSGMYRTDIYFLCKTFAQVSVSYVPDTPLIFLKITKIVRALWLVERRVCMRVYVIMVVTSRCFAFLALIRQARIWKSFWVENSTRFYFIYPFPRRLKLGKSLQTCCVNFFRLSWHFKREKSVFWKAAFLQNKNSLHVQDFATCKNFSFNQCHNK